jgi:hypothetical protein
MAKKIKSKNEAKSKAEAKTKVVANVRLVEAMKNYDTSKAQTQSYLCEVVTIIQEEMLTKAEVIETMMTVRGCTLKTAESQYSRMQPLLKNPEDLEALRNGETDLKSVREKHTKKQKNPSKEKAAGNAEKTASRAISVLMTSAKTLGWDKATLLSTIKAACKTAGII